MRSGSRKRRFTKLIISTSVILWTICAEATAGDGWYSSPGHPSFLSRFHPAGGWHPDTGGLWHWWNPCCFPRCGGPDDYCRKPPPNVCRPVYPPFYVGAYPAGCPDCVGRR